jgi:hypothetical protein
MNEFLFNLALVIAHTKVLNAKVFDDGVEEPMGEAWAVNTLAMGFLGSAIQDKPEVPDFKPINTTKEQKAAIAGNNANFAEISKLASSTNAFNQAELNKMLEAAIPGYRAMMETTGGRINEFLSGKLPADVSDNVGRNAAYRSLSGGFGGSGMARNLVARDLGLTSLDLISKGIDAGSRWISMAKQNTVAPQFDVSSMFITPQQRIQTQMWNREGQFNRDWLDNQVDAEYSWKTQLGRAIQTTDSQITNAAFSMAGSAAGGAGI